MAKNYIFTTKFSQYIKKAMKKQSVICVTRKCDYIYFVNDHIAFRMNKGFYDECLKPILCTDMPDDGELKNVSERKINSNIVDMVEKMLNAADTTIYKTPYVMQNKEFELQLLANKNDYKAVQADYFNMVYHDDSAVYQTAKGSNTPLIIHNTFIDFVVLPVRQDKNKVIEAIMESM